MPIQVAFQKAGYGTFDVVFELFKELFSNKKMPDLTDSAMLNVGHGYMRLLLLAWWLLTGADICGCGYFSLWPAGGGIFP